MMMLLGQTVDMKHWVTASTIQNESDKEHTRATVFDMHSSIE